MDRTEYVDGIMEQEIGTEHMKSRVCLSVWVCLSTCISQVILSLPGTFDLVRLKSWTRCHL